MSPEPVSILSPAIWREGEPMPSGDIGENAHRHHRFHPIQEKRIRQIIRQEIAEAMRKHRFDDHQG